jgi:hypothetical protein
LRSNYLKDIEEFKKYCIRKTTGRLINFDTTASIPTKFIKNKIKYNPAKYPTVITIINDNSLKKTLSDFLKLYKELTVKLNKAEKDTEIAFAKETSS